MKKVEIEIPDGYTARYDEKEKRVVLVREARIEADAIRKELYADLKALREKYEPRKKDRIKFWLRMDNDTEAGLGIQDYIDICVSVDPK